MCRRVKISAFNRNLALRACGFWESKVWSCVGPAWAGRTSAWFYCSRLWRLTIYQFSWVAIGVVSPVSLTHITFSGWDVTGSLSWVPVEQVEWVENKEEERELLPILCCSSLHTFQIRFLHPVTSFQAPKLAFYNPLIAWVSWNRVLYSWTQWWDVNWLSWNNTCE